MSLMQTNHIISRILIAFASIVLASAIARGDQLRFESGEKRVAFVELFTSEGCSSCPPAERTFSKLTTHPSLWKTFVPVAFHVNYWDNLGWKDRLASVEFTQRQHTYASAWRSDTAIRSCRISSFGFETERDCVATKSMSTFTE